MGHDNVLIKSANVASNYNQDTYIQQDDISISTTINITSANKQSVLNQQDCCSKHIASLNITKF